MRQFAYPLRAQRQDGSVAVEAALIISLVLVPLLAFILFFGRFFWYYTVAQKAAHDAALVMATAPLVDIKSFGASNLALGVIEREIADMDDATLATKGSTAECWFRVPATAPFIQPFTCNLANFTPVMVRTSTAMTVTDPFFAPFTESLLGGASLQITAQSSVRYVGR
jgi:Flp pilus assembly protein TadG